ncbi:MAG: hypothetical protein EPN33_03570 [Acidobacteria bacterium]|nr:MAG: hypothetical protein EPN33_03570 [Acidobacteriota bacterium]
MSLLTVNQRKHLPDSAFALPRKRAYPIPDTTHARAALARATQFATPREQTIIRRNVHRLYPHIKISK